MGRAVGRWGVGGWVPCGLGGLPSAGGAAKPSTATGPWGSARSVGSTWRGNTSPYQGAGCRCGWRAACPRICVPTCPRYGGRPARPPWRTCRGVGCVGAGGVVGGEEGVGAVHHPVVSWCVVVGGGEGVVQIVHESHVRGGGWLPVVGGGDVPRDVVPEVAQGGHSGYLCFPLPLFDVVGGGAGWGMGHAGLAVAGAALGAVPLRHGVSD